MSVLNKKPFINKIIEETSDSDLAILNGILNGTSETLFRSFINVNYPITSDDKGANHCVLETKDKVFTGYLLYNDLHCVLFAYDGKSQEITSLIINVGQDTYEIVNEELSINEFRQLICGVQKFETSNITNISDEELDSIKCGDIIVKKTISGDNILSHAYICTYKEDKAGICLSYFDASGAETVSYDYTDGHWMYNSTDR